MISPLFELARLALFIPCQADCFFVGLVVENGRVFRSASYLRLRGLGRGVC